MNLLLLTVTDQSNHSMGKYINLNCNYDFKNWIYGFSSINHNLSVFDYYEYIINNGPSATEHKIKKIIEKKKIDLVILPNMYFEIGVLLLNFLCKKGVKIVVTFFDDTLRFEDTTRYYIGLCNFIVTHESKYSLELYKNVNYKAYFFPNYPSIKFYEKLLGNKNNLNINLSEVCFVGANISDRSEYIYKLKQEGVKISVFGKGWPNGELSQKDMVQVYKNSKISLNFSKTYSDKNLKQLKGRAFEIILAGGFLLTEHNDELLDYFEIGKEIDSFSNVEECKEKIKFYLEKSNLRKTMQVNALKKCYSMFNFEKAWSSFINKIDNNDNSYELSFKKKNCPEASINNFINYNLKFFLARIKNKDFKLAIDQIIFCFKELSFNSSIYSKKIWFIFFKTVLLNLLMPIRRILLQIELFKIIKNFYLKK